MAKTLATQGSLRIGFTVYGNPQAQGSSRAFIPKGWKRPVITSANPKLKSWRQELSNAALVAKQEAKWTEHSKGPVYVSLHFFFSKPKSVKKDAIYKSTKPDMDKLMRATLDGMSGIIYHDDAQVSYATVRKCFGVPERVEIVVETL